MLLLAAISFVAGCSPSFEERGAGQDLYTNEMPAATNKLALYFRELCRQATLMPSSADVTCSDQTMLVQAGFNDVDSRCDQYIAWIDNKRSETARIKSSLTAIGIAATGALSTAKAGVESIAYAAQALGLANSLYDAYSNSMLLGLESSTIKRIVYERRLEFRRQFSKVNFFQTPDMVFALRSYLRICTPQTIVLDANTYALSAAAGMQPESLTKSVRQEVDAIRSGLIPVAAQTPANQKIPRGPVPKCPECDALFPPGSGFTKKNVMSAQLALCVEDDGNPGEGTLAAVRNFRDTENSDRVGPISEAEYSTLTAHGCKSGDLKAGYRNYFEAVTYRDNANELPQLVDDLNAILPNPVLDKSVTMNSEALRAKIAQARALYDQGTGNKVRDTLMSRSLKKRIEAGAHNKT